MSTLVPATRHLALERNKAAAQQVIVTLGLDPHCTCQGTSAGPISPESQSHNCPRASGLGDKQEDRQRAIGTHFNTLFALAVAPSQPT
jgi:hypothetical protein